MENSYLCITLAPLRNYGNTKLIIIYQTLNLLYYENTFYFFNDNGIF